MTETIIVTIQLAGLFGGMAFLLALIRSVLFPPGLRRGPDR